MGLASLQHVVHPVNVLGLGARQRFAFASLQEVAPSTDQSASNFFAGQQTQGKPPQSAASSTAQPPPSKAEAAGQSELRGPTITHVSAKDEKMFPLGRDSKGEICDCTDPAKKKISVAEQRRKLEAAKKKMFKQGSKTMKHKLEERRRANKAMKSTLRKFMQALGEYDDNFERMSSLYQKMYDKRFEYDSAFWDLHAVWKEKCEPFMKQHPGFEPDCDSAYISAREGKLARGKPAECLIGKESTFDEVGMNPIIANVPIWFSVFPPAATSVDGHYSRQRRRKPSHFHSDSQFPSRRLAMQTFL